MTRPAVPPVDIDAYRRAEAALRDRELELSQLVDLVPSHLWRLTPDGEPTFFNRRMVDFLGLDVTDTDKPGMTRLVVMIEAVVHPDDAAAFEGTLRRSLATGERFSMRYRLRRADGVYRWMSSRAEPLRDQSGRIVQWYGLCHDIDDQMQADEALRRNERQLQQMIDAVPVRIWSTTPAGGPVSFNKRYKDHLRTVVAGFDSIEEPRIDQLLQELVHPGDAPAVWGTLRNSFERGDGCVVRFRWREKEDAYRWAECRLEPWRDQSGAIVQWYGVSLDIDDEVRAQEALRDRERELAQLVDMVPIYLWRLNPDGEPNFFNKRLIDYFGLDVADADRPDTSRLAAFIRAVAHPDDAASLNEALNRCLVTGESFSMKYRLRRADGVYRWMEGIAEPMRDEDGRIVQWYGLCRDIDDQLHADEAVRQSERQLQQLIDTVPVLIFRATPDGNPVYANRRLKEFHGFEQEDFDVPGETRMARSLRVLVHSDHRPAVHEALQHSFRTGEPFAMRYRQRRHDGVYRWIEGRAEPLRDENGVIVQWYGVNLDIDDQMRAEAALRQSERELRLLVDMVPSHLWRLTPDGETTLANKRMADFLGVDVADTKRLEVMMNTIFHPDDAQEVGDVLGRCLLTGEPFSMKYRLRRADGVYRWMSGRAEPLRDESGHIVQWFGLCHDIDDQVHAEEALRRASDKLAQATQAASLAELSASIAHEVNQPLAAIVANSHACHRWLSTEPPNIERAKITVERITRDANAAADVVSRIRALFRHAPHATSSEDVNRLIGEICRLMADEIAAKDIRVRTILEPDLPSVVLDRVQVQQVLVNLIRNGIEAMDDGVIERALEICSCRDGLDAVRVEVRDAGTGFRDLERAFEPFFTTKGTGMGMGLTICRSIVESHGGRLWTANNPTRGATVAFTLPLAAIEAP